MRKAGNPHAACDVAGAGNGDMVRTEAPALARKPSATATPLTYIYLASPRPYRVEEFLVSNDEFEPDPTRERLPFTMHPKGYLKRIK